MENIIAILKTTNAKIIWASTTPVMARKGKNADAIARYNKAAEKLMKNVSLAGRFAAADLCARVKQPDSRRTSVFFATILSVAA